MNNNKFDLLIFDWEGTLANVDFSTKISQGAELFSGVELGIKDLKRQGYILSIATGKGLKSLNQDLISTNLKDYFLITKTVDECFSKPHPQMILEILNFTMVDPKKALMIGDSSYDLEMAKNAGISSLAVAYGSEPLVQLKEFDTLDLIENPYDLFDWLRING
ncbi:MAG: phosphoglycolate phosphatase [Methylophilaceae bacterium]|jgi:phosphoglycolate phosphatase